MRHLTLKLFLYRFLTLSTIALTGYLIITIYDYFHLSVLGWLLLLFVFIKPLNRLLLALYAPTVFCNHPRFLLANMGLEIEEIATLYGEYQQVLLEITPAHHPKLYFDTGFGLGPGSAGTLSNGVITIDLSTLLLFSPDERKAAFAHELKHLLGSDNLF